MTPSDTWGIPGPVFLRWYLLLAVVVVVGAIVHRRRMLEGTPVAVHGGLGPQQVAFLNGGDQLAVWAALGGLRHAGVVGVRPDRRLTTGGPLPAGATPVDQAVHHAASRGLHTRELAADEWVRRAVDELRDDLVRRGLALDQERRRTLRRGALLVGFLLAIGIVRTVTGLFNDRPTGWLLLSLFPLGLAFVLLNRVPWRTRAATAALNDMRRRHAWLRPDAGPAYATYGPTEVALGVALFGTATLWTMDPGFAEQAEIQRQALGHTGGASTGTSCGGGPTAGGASSCGGSSCGGGGGCGGGCGG
ncbi:TIGR04222 domain-containing membrane protein [Micromonospora marina]|uniref:TIGR04222 domain-containing protein n=1 Tax=Micromonospora marina TaxID=307120 RepID=A0A1C4ZGS4_9ACTN|nr:TIGR04222 domain-containing membrane protein [Micromonospora marina]SCF32233.1 TIGR04222 domain-containing protein [Micromonospora marina]